MSTGQNWKNSKRKNQMSSQYTLKRLGMFGKIETKEDARGVIKDTSNWFYGLGALQIVLTFLAGYTALITGIIFIVLAFLLRKLNSRIAAILLLILSGFDFVFTFFNVFSGGQGGGHIFLASAFTWASIRAVQAAFRLNSLSTEFDQAIQLDPNLPESYNDRGFAYNTKGEYNCAITDFNQAIRLDPNLVDAYLGRGDAYYIKGDLENAIADYDHALKLNPNDAEAYLSRGSAYFQAGDKEKAIADFKNVLELSNDPELCKDAEEQLQALGVSD
jgi:tetratricopeptide (TPR) repeat protein